MILLRLEERADDHRPLVAALLHGYEEVRALPTDHQRLLEQPPPRR